MSDLTKLLARAIWDGVPGGDRLPWEGAPDVARATCRAAAEHVAEAVVLPLIDQERAKAVVEYREGLAAGLLLDGEELV